MNLLLDLGNTRLKWAIADGSKLSAAASFRYRLDTLEELQRSDYARLPAPNRVLLCSVGRRAMHEYLHDDVCQRWQLKIEPVPAKARQLGVTSGYDQPETLGADRWVAMIAAHQHYSGALCVVDCGTAVTIDVLDANGQHLGGLIIPGLSTMRDALGKHTQGLPQKLPQKLPMEIRGAVSLLASNTEDALASGAVHAVAAAVTRVMDCANPSVQPLTCILTGGDADAVGAGLGFKYVTAPQLVLQGLAMVAESGP